MTGDSDTAFEVEDLSGMFADFVETRPGNVLSDDLCQMGFLNYRYRTANLSFRF